MLLVFLVEARPIVWDKTDTHARARAHTHAHARTHTHTHTHTEMKQTRKKVSELSVYWC